MIKRRVYARGHFVDDFLRDNLKHSPFLRLLSDSPASLLIISGPEVQTSQQKLLSRKRCLIELTPTYGG